MAEKPPAIRVIIYGQHSGTWMTALAPGAPVWRRIPAVEEVLLIPDTPGVPIPNPSRDSIRTVVIPLMESHTNHCPRHYPSLIPDEYSVYTLGDKAAFSDYVKANGLLHLCPRTYASIAEARFPCVLKRVDLNTGRGVVIVRTPEELQSLLEQPPWAGHRVILQALVIGAVEYVTHSVCKDGRILWHCTFALEMNSPQIIRSATTRIAGSRMVVASPLILSQIEEFLIPLAYNGPCNVDYKISADGNIIAFEINPRLGGTLMWPQHIDCLHGALSHIIDPALDRAVHTAA